jgi:archaellum component FlaC
VEQQAEISFSLTTLDSHLNKFNATLGQITKSVATIQESVNDDLELNRKLLQAAQTYQ